ncbi:hypothetical protein [Novosphingobium sp.]|uniref:hypothetical protein n=1 Tax=Novosphingobium sp. TaxID=1874826 RepID=UPI003BAA26AB
MADILRFGPQSAGGWAPRAMIAVTAAESGPCALLSASQVPKNTIKMLLERAIPGGIDNTLHLPCTEGARS